MSLKTYVDKKGNEAVIDDADAPTVKHYASMGYKLKEEKPAEEVKPADDTGGDPAKPVL